MKTRTLRIVSILVGTLFLSNCANQRQGSTLLPVMGAGLGAAIGSALLKDDKEMGLALGAVAGYGAGKLAENRKAKKQLELYNDGYKKGQSDSVKTLYWAQRNAERAEEPPPRIPLLRGARRQTHHLGRRRRRRPPQNHRGRRITPRPLSPP